MKISKSKLLSFITCPEKYYLGYELNIRPAKTPSDLIIGSSTHHLIASHYIRERAGESRPGRDDLQESLSHFWSRYSLDNTDFMTQEDLVTGMHQSLEFARLFLDETDFEPLEVEYRFSLPVVNIKTGEVIPDLELTGIIDLIDCIDGKSRAIEIKTKSRRPDGFQAEMSMELTCYAYWLRFLDDSETIPVSYVNIVKNRKPYIHWQNQERSTEDFVDLFHTIKTVAENIRDGRFYKNPGVHCNWCDYKPVCSKDVDAVKGRFSSEAIEALQDQGLIRV